MPKQFYIKISYRLQISIVTERQTNRQRSCYFSIRIYLIFISLYQFTYLITLLGKLKIYLQQNSHITKGSYSSGVLLYSQNAEVLGDKTMEEKLLLKPNNGKQNYPCVDQNHWLDSLYLRS